MTEAKFDRNPDVVWQQGEESMKEDGDDRSDEVTTSVIQVNENVMSLNEMGTKIWKLCDGRTISEMTGILTESHDVAPEELRNNLTYFLHNLEKFGFVIKR